MNTEEKKEAPYYDKNGVEIQSGDLLKVFHFIHYQRRRKCYMYHVAVLEGGYWRAREYHAEKTHYNLRSVTNPQTRIAQNYEIISKPDWENEDRLRAEGRERIKVMEPTQ